MTTYTTIRDLAAAVLDSLDDGKFIVGLAEPPAAGMTEWFAPWPENGTGERRAMPDFPSDEIQRMTHEAFRATGGGRYDEIGRARFALIRDVVETMHGGYSAERATELVIADDDDQITSLMDEARNHDDREMVAICERALRERKINRAPVSGSDRLRCARVIVEAMLAAND